MEPANTLCVKWTMKMRVLQLDTGIGLPSNGQTHSVMPSFSTDTYHCNSPRKIKLEKMDPSCCIGFYLRTKEEYKSWCDNIIDIVKPPQINGIRHECPMFVVAEGRCDDNRVLNDWIKLGRDSVSINTGAPEELESDEFVFL